MPVAEAGKHYLSIVCPANKASGANNAAFAAQDLAAIQQTATVARDTYQQQAKQFTNPMKLWPPQVNDDIKKLVESDYAAIASYDALSRSVSLDAANQITFANNDDSGAAAQRIRIALNLPADTSAGC